MKIELTLTALGMTFHHIWGNPSASHIIIELAGIVLTIGVELKIAM